MAKWDLTEDAANGFKGTACDALPTSPAWYAWHAGELLAKEGTHRPVKAKMGRGYSVVVEFFNGSRTCVKFDKRDRAFVA